MRGRLWVLYLLQSSAAAFCCGLSQMGASLGGSMAMVACMALTVTAAAGATFGIIPFISRRGLVSAAGSACAMNQACPLHASTVPSSRLLARCREPQMASSVPATA